MNSDTNKDLSIDFHDTNDAFSDNKLRKNSVLVAKIDSRSSISSNQIKLKQPDNSVDDYKDRDWEMVPLHSEFLQKGKSEFNSDNYD